MTISASVVADSISSAGKRLTTMQLRYPRFIHAEFMTHRVFSRNASSSRAIPVKKMIEMMRDEPAMPEYWGSNKPGMQAGAELDEEGIKHCKMYWRETMEDAINMAESMVDRGLHKQIANRILEPWAHISVVVTATEWDNFYELRCHPDAQPEMRMLAEAMRDAQADSTPTFLRQGEWHVPYFGTVEDMRAISSMADNQPDREQLAIKMSVARCARVSYMTHDGRVPNPEEDLKLYERLVGSKPLHASPCEHQATPDAEYGGTWGNRHLWGNFTRWVQYRKTIEL